ncbi:MAG: GDSL-type esterase/lipase family protein [Desulfosporosinus sp.]|nr:GDSL-type esterase/lipase family protein [Desulfosporosinus sp.]
MLNKPTKIEVYIILWALVLALLTLVFFWGRNRVAVPPHPVSSQKSVSTTLTPLIDSKTMTDSKQSEQTTVTLQGLTKIMAPAPVNALLLGDAIAASRGASDLNLVSWYALVAKDLHSKYPGTLQWQLHTNAEGTINDALNYLPEVPQDTDLIVLCLGQNDPSKVKLSEFKQKYEQLLVELKAKSPQADLFLVTEPPVKNNLENNKYFLYRGVILELAQKYQLHVIDEWTTFIQDPAPLASLLANNVDPNDKGYRVFADAVLKSFDDYLITAN